MAESRTSKRVGLNMIFATELPPAEVQLRVMAAISDRLPVDHTSVHGWDLDEPETGSVQLVVHPTDGLVAVYVDRPEAATERARILGGLVIDWTADEDYRPEIPQSMGERS